MKNIVHIRNIYSICPISDIMSGKTRTRVLVLAGGAQTARILSRSVDSPSPCDECGILIGAGGTSSR